VGFWRRCGGMRSHRVEGAYELSAAAKTQNRVMVFKITITLRRRGGYIIHIIPLLALLLLSSSLLLLYILYRYGCILMTFAVRESVFRDANTNRRR